jgi:hypothetical protein
MFIGRRRFPDHKTKIQQKFPGRLVWMRDSIKHRQQCRCANFNTRLMNRGERRLQELSILYVVDASDLHL